MSRTWSTLLTSLTDGCDLSEEDTAWAMDQIMSGHATSVHIAGLAVALRIKGETAAELAGLACSMLAHAQRVRVDSRIADVVGTGGDGAHTVNISTMAALVVAAAGVPVIKHGNRAMSSKCGAADVLEALGIAIDLPPDAVRRCVAKVGIGFCFSPVYHPAMRHARQARRELGIPTIFNFLGPLTNPAAPTVGLVGCADQRMTSIMAEVFARRGDTVLLVRGDDGLDELTTTTTSTVLLVRNGATRQDSVDPLILGIPRAKSTDLLGGDATENADVVRRVLNGEPGPIRDAVLLNAAGALAAYAGFSSDLLADLRNGLTRAIQAVDSGAAMQLLTRWRNFLDRR